jgi:hypothetical protein
MWKPSKLVVGLCALAALAVPSHAQEKQKEETRSFVRDVLKQLLGPNWNVSAHGGATTTGRFLLQDAFTAGERSLTSQTGWNVGAGAGVDFLPRVGLRLSYTFAENDLEYRTDNGNGSDALDLDDIGRLRSNVAAVELVRYMLPWHATISPYGSIGLQGTWWSLGDESPFIVPSGGSTQFRLGALVSFGMHFYLSERWGARVDAVSSSIRNPFTGKHSLVSVGGTTFDEPTRVNKSDYRVSVFYSFNRKSFRESLAAFRR